MTTQIMEYKRRAKLSCCRTWIGSL